MAKGDFDVEEPEYYENSSSDLTKRDDNKINLNNDKINNSQNKDLYTQDYSENSDFSKIGVSQSSDYIDNSNVVFEDKTDMTPEERVKDFFSSLNKSMIIFFGGIALFILIVIIVVLVYLYGVKKSYYSDIEIPDIIYMGETGNIKVNAHGKKDLNNTETTFTSSNAGVVSFVSDKLKGKDINNTLVPVQEGKATISIDSHLGNRKMAKIEKKVVVCPAFNSDLLLTKNLSLINGSTYELNIDFGEPECSKNIKYESSNENILQVEDGNRIRGMDVGKTILTIKNGERTISVDVDVTKDYIEMKTFNVTPSKIQLKKGDRLRIKVDYSPITATSKRIEFDNSNMEVVDISDGGLIKALKPGVTTIHVSPGLEALAKDIEITVLDAENKDGTEVTEMKLNKNNVTLTQGNSEKILASITPSTAKDKTITWKSSDEKVATVTQSGVIFARGNGTATITASTSNNVSQAVSVEVISMSQPVIASSDGLPTGVWHKKPYALNFSGSDKDVVYYYGTSENKMNNTGKKVTIKKDGESTYYVKSCKNGVCSKVVSYESKLDATRPKVQTVSGIDNTAVTEDTVSIAMQDATSKIQKWCVTTIKNHTSCKWKTIQINSNPVISYTAKYNDTYYVFAKDTAGNISDSYTFQITNIE